MTAQPSYRRRACRSCSSAATATGSAAPRSGPAPAPAPRCVIPGSVAAWHTRQPGRIPRAAGRGRTPPLTVPSTVLGALFSERSKSLQIQDKHRNKTPSLRVGHLHLRRAARSGPARGGAASLAFPAVDRFCMAVLYGRVGSQQPKTAVPGPDSGGRGRLRELRPSDLELADGRARAALQRGPQRARALGHALARRTPAHDVQVCPAPLPAPPPARAASGTSVASGLAPVCLEARARFCRTAPRGSDACARTQRRPPREVLARHRAVIGYNSPMVVC
jgi:hypothetical protein